LTQNRLNLSSHLEFWAAGINPNNALGIGLGQDRKSLLNTLMKSKICLFHAIAGSPLACPGQSDGGIQI
jgi:hypothetical protein